MSSPLTDKQTAVLDLIRRCLARGEPPPTNQEICDEFGWRSTRSARDHLRALVRKGYVEMSDGRGHRRVRLPGEPATTARVPLLGRVAAGVPVESEENVEDSISVPAKWIEKGRCFAVRVSGESMKDAGILDGDLIVARQQSVAADGDIVVATLDGATTLKRLRRRGKQTVLVAENRHFRSIPVRTESAIVQGVVVGLVRDYRPGRGPNYHQHQRRATTSGEGTIHADGT